MLRLRALFTGGVLLTFAATLGQAHEIKVLASRLAVTADDGKTTIYLSWGHRLPVDDLVDAAALDRYDLLAPEGTVTALKKADLALQTNVVELTQPGVHQAVVVRRPSVFTFVWDADGNRQMKRGPRTNVKEGRIDYAQRSRQCAKALLVVGPAPREPVKPAGLPLEIVPLDAPSAWTRGAALRFQVLLDGQPLPSAEVTARYVGFKPDDAWCYATSTGRGGVATVVPERLGDWVLKVNTKRLTHSSLREQYDFEAFTATLTLEIRP